jgi:ADP-ribosylglycohydrolase
MELETYLHPHILGGLYGQALGDAWGMPAAFRPEQTWSLYNGWLDRLVAVPPDHAIHAGFQAGQITDDTQQAMALVEAIITDGQITVEGAARALVTWYDQVNGDNSPFVGPSTRRAVTALKAGGDPYQTGLQGDTNGGAMRVSPIGLIHPGNPEAAVEDAIIACTPTHFTDVAVSGACAIAAAVARALTPDTTLEDIIDVAIHGADIGLRRGAPWFGASVARKIDFAVQLATDVNLSERDRLQNLYDLIGATLATADAVPCAFGVLAMANGNPIETAIYAANLSGDADTIGSMACAIAGAWQGINAISLEYLEIIRRANQEYDFEETAEALYEIARSNYYASSAPTGAPPPDQFPGDQPI